MKVGASSPLADFVFGFGISTVAGATVFGTNTSIDGFIPGQLGGSATVVLDILSLDLAPGVYSVDAAIHARDGSPYDYRRDVLRFEVTAERASAGVWSPERKWSFAGEVRWKS
jgi:hypothetical protein